MVKLGELTDVRKNITTISNLSPVYGFEYNNISEIVNIMIKSYHRRLPILNKNNDLTGIITYTDILDALLRGLTPRTQTSSFMVKDIVTCKKDDTIAEVLQKLKISKHGGLPIVSGKKLVGIVTERDYINLLKGKILSKLVNEVMTKKPFYIPANTSILNCMKAMINTHYRRFPVVENKKLVGIVTALDILNYLSENGYNISFLNENTNTIMKTNVYSVSEEADLSDVVKIILEEGVGGVAVVNGENLIGIVTERDILNIMEVF